MNAEILLAAALLAGPRAEADVAVIEALRPQILALAIEAEVIDQREKGFLMTACVMADLETIQTRFAELAGAPALSEHTRFPDRHLTNEMLSLNRQWRTALAERLKIDLFHAEEIAVTIAELDRRYEIWDCVRDSHQDYCYVTIRRQALRRLRELIGERRFYSGDLPAVIP